MICVTLARPSQQPKQCGFTLIELMVAIVIGLITVLIMMQAISVAEGYRRTSNSGGDAQTGGALSLYAMQRDIRLAGYGFSGNGANNAALTQCSVGTTTKIFFSGRTGGGGANVQTLTFTPATSSTITAPAFVPVAIVPSSSTLVSGIADQNTDVIQVIYSQNMGTTGAGIPVSRLTSTTSPTAEWMVTTGNWPRGGLRHGDLALLAGTAGCTIFEITGLPASGNCGDASPTNWNGTANANSRATGSAVPFYSTSVDEYTIEARTDTSAGYQNFYRTETNYPSATCPIYDNPLVTSSITSKQLTLQRWNTAGLDTNTSGLLFPLGSRPDIDANKGLVAKVYAVRNGKLMSCNLLTDDCYNAGNTSPTPVWTVISDNVVSLVAHYGLGAPTSAGNYTFTAWQSSTNGPVTASEWENVIAIKFAVVARAQQYEKDCVTDAGNIAGCQTGAAVHNNNPKWSKVWVTGGTQDIDLSAVADWQHFRYRTLETTIPLRNSIWK